MKLYKIFTVLPSRFVALLSFVALTVLSSFMFLSCEDTPSQPEPCGEPTPTTNFLKGQYTYTVRTPTGNLEQFQYSLFRFSDDFSPVLKFLMREDTTRDPVIHIFNGITATYTFDNDTLIIQTPVIYPDGKSFNVPQGKFDFTCGVDSFFFVAHPDSVTTMRMTISIP